MVKSALALEAPEEGEEARYAKSEGLRGAFIWPAWGHEAEGLSLSGRLARRGDAPRGSPSLRSFELEL